MSYIGRDPIYGVFEKQVLSAGSTQYILNWQAGSATSLLIVSNGQVLEPIVDYNLILDGKTIVFANPLANDAYIVYLGRELEVAHTIGIQPILNKFTGVTGQTTFNCLQTSTENIGIDENMVIVFVNGVQQTSGVDFSINGKQIIFTVAPVNGAAIDVYIHGVERFDQFGELEWKSFVPAIVGLGGMIATANVITAKYLEQNTKTGKLIKIKLDFICTFTGSLYNKVRYALPFEGTVDEVIPAVVTIDCASENILETGVHTWGATNKCDIQRQHGINYVLNKEFRFKIRAEYDI